MGTSFRDERGDDLETPGERPPPIRGYFAYRLGIGALIFLIGGAGAVITGHVGNGLVGLAIGAACFAGYVLIESHPVRRWQPDRNPPTALDATLPPFRRVHLRPAYDIEMVDQFFDEISNKTIDAITAAQLKVVWKSGYDQQAVGRALDGWAIRVSR